MAYSPTHHSGHRDESYQSNFESEIVKVSVVESTPTEVGGRQRPREQFTKQYLFPLIQTVLCPVEEWVLSLDWKHLGFPMHSSVPILRGV